VTQITDHLAETRERISNALEAAGRAPDGTLLLAVSKQQSAESIEAAWLAGQRHFGESFVQEALAKMQRLAHRDIVWHFIGRIQSNKTRDIAERFQWVHTVDRARIALRLNAQRPRFALPLKVLIQVNLAQESQKAGVAEAELAELAALIAAQPRLKLEGLMCIPPADDTPDEKGARFKRLAELQRDLATQGLPTQSLSMGMSGDFELAIAQGSTCVRVGEAIFGTRKARQP
jgi:hypothetical protein